MTYEDGLPFLATRTMFWKANQTIQDDSFDNLVKKYQESILQKDLNQAKLIAQKISILYGFKGLYLYVPVQVDLIKIDKNNHELIGQALIKVLSLIFFIEKHSSVDLKKTVLNAHKETCLALCHDNEKAEITSEAEHLADLYLGR